MKQLNRQTGNKGENVAIEKLQAEGYEILERNYKNKWGEVDIISKRHMANGNQEDVVVFVEVKTKTEDVYGEPWEMIDRHKLKQIENMGHLWCEEYRWTGLCRIDVVGVWLDMNGSVTRVEHWENVQI